jgi:hypothetical protein
MEHFLPQRNELRGLRLLLTAFFVAQAVMETILQSLDAKCIGWIWSTAAVSYVSLWLVEVAADACCKPRLRIVETPAATAPAQPPTASQSPQTAAAQQQQNQLLSPGRFSTHTLSPNSNSNANFGRRYQPNQYPFSV